MRCGGCGGEREEGCACMNVLDVLGASSQQRMSVGDLLQGGGELSGGIMVASIGY